MGDQSVAGTGGTVGGPEAIITNNTVSNFSTFAATKGSIHVNLGTTSGDTYQACVDILNNNASAGGSTDSGAGSDYLVRQRQATTMRLPGYGGANNDNAAVISYIQGHNTGSESVFVQSSVPTGGGFIGTPILTPPDISIKDASVSEPSSGSSPAAFTVILSHAFSQPVMVNFATANDMGGANPATAGADYTSTSGTLTFNPGEVVQTISVPVLADADNAETSETFLVNLSDATGAGAITDSQAVGTITTTSTPGNVVISELRTSGPAGSDDEFVELLDNTDSDITVQASDSSAGWSLVKSGSGCSETPVVVAVIPNGTVIPARGNYLLVGSDYSLAGYATGDQTLANRP